jgi:DNA-binding NarL/FixJ family response regulator
MVMTISVVLAEGHPLIRERMHALLAAANDIEVLAACGDGAELRRTIGERAPDVVVTGNRMPPGPSDEGIRIAHELRRHHPQAGVVVISSADNPAYAADLLHSGARGRAYLLKERLADPGQLVQAVRQVAAGGSVIDPAVAAVLPPAHCRPVRQPQLPADPAADEPRIDA